MIEIKVRSGNIVIILDLVDIEVCAFYSCCMIYPDLDVESFHTFSEHEQLSTAGVQYIVNGSWKNKLFCMPSRERRKRTKL